MPINVFVCLHSHQHQTVHAFAPRAESADLCGSDIHAKGQFYFGGKRGGGGEYKINMQHCPKLITTFIACI